MRDRNNHDVDAAEKQALLEELTLSNAPTIQTLRSSAVTALPVSVRPADSIARDALHLSGRAHAVRSQSLAVILGSPVTVGSFFELQLGDEAGDGGSEVVFARCEQVTMSGEGRFDSRFQLMSAIDVGAITGQVADA